MSPDYLPTTPSPRRLRRRGEGVVGRKMSRSFVRMVSRSG